MLADVFAIDFPAPFSLQQIDYEQDGQYGNDNWVKDNTANTVYTIK